jgi:Domain of unknown function (DUF4136)
MKVFQRLILGFALSGTMAMVPCALAQQVSTDFDHTANFETYHTFSFYKVKTANPLFEQRVKDAITADLQHKGWQMVPSGGDIAITAIGDVQQQQEYTTFYDDIGGFGYGYRGWGGRWGGWGGRGWGGGPSTATTTQQTIPVGTLIVDLYDTRSKNLVFRGRATDQLHVKHTDKNIAIVNKSVDKMFDHFPPKSSR